MRAGKIIKLPELAIKSLNNGGVGVILTDTIYGLVASALDSKVANYVRRLKNRDENKPFIVLISSIKDIPKFGIEIDKETSTILRNVWPGKVSVIIECKNKKLSYIHRNTDSIAFRLPKNTRVLNILKKTGPLIAPSANPQGLKPATSVTKAKKYFGNQVDFYLKDKVRRGGKPSKVIKILEGGKIEVIRK